MGNLTYDQARKIGTDDLEAIKLSGKLPSGTDYDGTLVKDINLERSKGNVDGESHMSKYGENPDIDTASGFEYIWDAGGTYVPPTQARLHNVTSDSGSDDGNTVSSGTATGGSTMTLIDTGATFVSDGVSVGDVVLNDTNVTIAIVGAVTSETVITFNNTIRDPEVGLDTRAVVAGDEYRIVTDASVGASVMFIMGLSASFLDQREFVVLDGTNVVATTKTWPRQFRARVFASGATGAVGIITSTAQTDGTVSCQIIDGNNQSLMSIYTVPIDKIGYITRWWGSMSKRQTAVSVVRMRAGQMNGIGYVLQTRAISTTGSSDFNHSWSTTGPLILPGGADIWVEADSSANDVGISSGFDIKLVDK